MTELEKILRDSIGKLVSVHYIIPEIGEHSVTGDLISVSDEVIEIEGIMTRHINRKATVLIEVGIKGKGN